jgi:hypothetical protein
MKGFLADAPISPESCGMKLTGRRAARVLSVAAPLLFVAMLAPAQTRQSHPAPLPAVPLNAPVIGESPSAAVRQETRLRKLHLVRPDLIPYPIAFEVYC